MTPQATLQLAQAAECSCYLQSYTRPRPHGFPTINRLRPPAVIVESTYGVSSHSPREEREALFITQVKRVLLRGGRLLLPVVALGRAQVSLLCSTLDVWLPVLPGTCWCLWACPGDHAAHFRNFWLPVLLGLHSHAVLSRNHVQQQTVLTVWAWWGRELGTSSGCAHAFQLVSKPWNAAMRHSWA